MKHVITLYLIARFRMFQRNDHVAKSHDNITPLIIIKNTPPTSSKSKAFTWTFAFSYKKNSIFNIEFFSLINDCDLTLK